MKVLLNEGGYVESFAIIGDLVDGIEVPEPSDMEHFTAHFEAYGLADGELVFNDVRERALEYAKQVAEIKERREKECFPVINRGQLWYDRLTEEQHEELNAWYQAWLDAPGNLHIPEPLTWV